MQILQIRFRIGLSVFVTVTKLFILPRKHISCLNILHRFIPEIRENFRLNDVCLMFPCILFQARSHILFIQLVEVLKQHIKVTVCLKQKSSLPVLCLTFGNKATLALLFSLPLPVLITNHSIPSAVFILIYGHYSSPAFFLGGFTEYTRSLKYSRFTLPVTVINPLSESS